MVHSAQPVHGPASPNKRPIPPNQRPSLNPKIHKNKLWKTSTDRYGPRPPNGVPEGPKSTKHTHTHAQKSASRNNVGKIHRNSKQKKHPLQPSKTKLTQERVPKITNSKGLQKVTKTSPKYPPNGSQIHQKECPKESETHIKNKCPQVSKMPLKMETNIHNKKKRL